MSFSSGFWSLTWLQYIVLQDFLVFTRRNVFLQRPTKKASISIRVVHIELNPIIPLSQCFLTALPKREPSNSCGLARIDSMPCGPCRIPYSTGPELSTHREGCVSEDVPDWCTSRCRSLFETPFNTFHVTPYSRSPIMPPVKDINSSNDMWNCSVGVPTRYMPAASNWIPNI